MFSLLGLQTADTTHTTFLLPPHPAANKRVLVQDEYEEILAIGTNLNGQNLVCSLAIAEDEGGEENVAYHFAIVATESDYADFMLGKIPYRALFNPASRLYVVRREWKQPDVAYCVTVDDIPSDYLPSTQSYIPKAKTT